MGNQPSSQQRTRNAELEQLEKLLSGTDELLRLNECYQSLASVDGSADGEMAKSVLEGYLQVPLPPPVVPFLRNCAEEVADTVRGFGKAIVARAFSNGDGPINRVSFLRGTVAVCKQGTAGRMQMLVSLVDVKTHARSRGAPSSELPDVTPAEEDMLSEDGIRSLFLLSWLMMFHVRQWRYQGVPPGQPAGTAGEGGAEAEPTWELPDFEPLVKAAFAGAGDGSLVQGRSGTGTLAELTDLPQGDLVVASRVASWLLQNLPGLSSALPDYVTARLIGVRAGAAAAKAKQLAGSKGTAASDAGRAGQVAGLGGPAADLAASRRRLSDSTALGSFGTGASGSALLQADQEGSPGQGRERGREASVSSSAQQERVDVERGLLSSGTAWAIGLSQRGLVADILVNVGCEPEGWAAYHPKLLYRASAHGRGMNRFTSHVDGYRETVLLLIASSKVEPGGEGVGWLFGAIVAAGFANNSSYYGSSSCCLLALKPRVAVFPASGRESNFVYTHTRLHGVKYQTKPVADGIGLGGSAGSERLWMDEEFSKVTIRHHSVDKTYMRGSLVPEQGYVPLEGKVEEVEVWGLGGREADKQQDAHRQREALFTQQRRQIDMKKFAAGWAEEKALMDLLSNPNEPRKEER